MECNGLWRARPGFVDNITTDKWGTMNWYNDVHREIELERCKNAAPAAITDPVRSSAPLTQAAVASLVETISSARGVLLEYVSTKLATLDDGSL